MRIIFAGTPAVTWPTLAALAERHDVAAVLTRPPARQGRSSRLVDSPAAVRARELGIEVVESSKPSEPQVRERLRAFDADLGVVVAYGAILRPDVLDLPKRGWVNLHFSALPDLRGAAPLQRAIMRGDTELSTTVFQLDEGMDTGPVYSVRTHSLDGAIDAGDALDALAQLGAQQVLDVVDQIELGATAKQQPVAGASLAPKLVPADCFVSFRERVADTVNRVRAVSPQPSAWAMLDGKRVKLRGVRKSDPQQCLAPGAFASAKRALLVGCADGTVEVDEVAPAGKSWMAGGDWARGVRGKTEFDEAAD